MTRVVNVASGEPYDVYIGRNHGLGDGYWGNPYRIGPDGTRGDVLRLYAGWLRMKLQCATHEDSLFVSRLLELKGKTLGCHCKPLACHGDIIAAYLDAGKLPEAGL